VFGNGKWSRDDFGNWNMEGFTITDFTTLQDSTLGEAVSKLRSIPEGIESHEDPLGELRRIRRGTRKTQ
jgi:hypothetical protein